MKTVSAQYGQAKSNQGAATISTQTEDRGLDQKPEEAAEAGVQTEVAEEHLGRVVLDRRCSVGVVSGAVLTFQNVETPVKWRDVVRRGNRVKERKRLEEGREPKQQKTTQEKTRAAPTTVTIKETGRTYADLWKKLKTGLDPSSVGTEVQTIRRRLKNQKILSTRLCPGPTTKKPIH